MERLSFDEAVRVFMLFCKSKGLAWRTLETYEFALGGLRQFLLESSDLLDTPNRDELRTYIAHLLEKGLARTTISIRMRAIRCFCRFLAREGLVESNPMTNVAIPKVPEKYPEILTVEQIKRLLAAAKSASWTGVRNYAMITTFLDTGMRLSELINLELEDVDLTNWSIRIRNGKGGKERYVFMGRGLFRALRNWLNLRGVTFLETAYFVTRNGNRHDLRNVERIIERVACRAGLVGIRVTPHILRHTFATHYIKNGGDPFSLQRILGHSDIKTTMIYVNLAGVGLREAHAKASPVDRLLSGS